MQSTPWKVWWVIYSRRKDLEKNISTQQHLSETNPWIQIEDENQIRTFDSQEKASQGKKTPERLRNNSLDRSYPQAARIRSREDYLLTQREGKRFSGVHIILLCRKNGLALSRFGQTVSRKAGNAVARNSIKRRFREMQRLNRHRTSPGYDIVVIARKRAGGASYQALESEYLELARRAGLIKEVSGLEAPVTGTDIEID
jgi:ribonuclease P protein component